MRVSVDEALRKAEASRDLVAVVTLNPDAESEARRVEEGGREPRPLVVKDIIYTAGLRTTMGSRVFKDFVPRDDAEVVKRLRAAGYVVIGKGNTHEFASGATTTSSVFGPTRNPLDPERIAGGSSGGSAAAVAAGVVDVALGTDTAGSVRIPASLCGIIGFRPTHGLVPRAGVFPLAPSLDDVGFLARSIDDIVEALMAVTRGRLRRPDNVREVRLAVPTGLYMGSEEVLREFNDLLPSLNAGQVELPLAASEGRAIFTAIRLSEASAVHLRYKYRWGEYFPDVRRLMEKGLQVPAVDYVRAMRLRGPIRRELERALKNYDALITPATAIPAPRIDEVLGREDGEVRDMLTGNAWLASLTGAPAVNLPLMRVGGLPVGVQLIGRPGEDVRLLEVARKVLEAVGPKGAPGVEV